MQVAALLVFLANTSSYVYPPLARRPIIQAATFPLSRASLFQTLPSPECTFNSQVQEGRFTLVDTFTTTLCRSIPDMTTTNQSFQIIQMAFNPIQNSWTIRQRIPGFLSAPNFGSSLLTFASLPTNEIWMLQQTPNPNIGPITAFSYLPSSSGSPVSSPVVITDSSKGFTLLDLQLTQNGLWAHGRRGSAAGSTGLLETGVLNWPLQSLPRRPIDGFSWLPGTNSTRWISAFFVPDTLSVISSFYISPMISPVTVEEWRLDLTRNTWNRYGTTAAPSQTSPLLQIVGLQTAGSSNGLILVGQKTLSVLTSNAGGSWSEILLSQISQSTPLAYRGAVSAFINANSPSPTPSPSSSSSPTSSVYLSLTASPTPTETYTYSLTSSPTPTETSSESQTTTSSPTASFTPSVTIGLTPTITPSSSPSDLYSQTPSLSPTSTPTVSTIPPSIVQSYSFSASLTPSPIASSSTNTTTPPAAIATGLTPGERAGIGLGVSAALLFVGVGIGFFAKGTTMSIFSMIQNLFGKNGSHPLPKKTVHRPPIDPSTIQISVNPSHIHQANLDALEKAREFRNEAFKMQKEKLSFMPENARNSLKILFKPMPSPISLPGATV
jgi:hypothetical protein